MGNCSNCKFWNDRHTYRPNEVVDVTHQACSRIVKSWDGAAFLRSSRFEDAHMFTARDFGCVLWEQK